MSKLFDITEELKRNIIKDYKSIMSFANIALKYGLREIVVMRTIHKAGIKRVRQRIPASKHKDIIQAYSIDLVTMQELADIYNCTRQTIWYILQRNSIDTTKAGAGNVLSTCLRCGKIVSRKRKQYKATINHYCSIECYHATLNESCYRDSRKGRNEARELVRKYIELKPGYIVHHEDYNQDNNTLSNLKVFKCHADHLKYHRVDKTIKPIWDGSKIK